jgi:hypothetical protein
MRHQCLEAVAYAGIQAGPSRGCDHFTGRRILDTTLFTRRTLRMNFPLFSIGSLSLLAGCTNHADGMDLESLVARHVEARGGEAAIEAVQSFETDIRIVEPTFAVDGRYIAMRDGRMRVDISVEGERVFTEALDRGSAWSWSPGEGARTATAQGAAALRRGIESPFKLFGMHEMQRRGHRLEFSGRESIDGVDYHVLHLTLDDGFESRYYVHPETWLIDRDRQLRALHVDVNPEPEWIETFYDDYRAVDGVMYAHRQTERRLDSGELLATVTVNAIRLNRPVSDDRFRSP